MSEKQATYKTINNLITVAHVWCLDDDPDHFVIERTNGALEKFVIAPMRIIDENELQPYLGQHPRKLRGRPLDAILYPYYGLEKSEESLSEVIRLRVGPTEKALYEAFCASKGVTSSNDLRNYIRSVIEK